MLNHYTLDKNMSKLTVNTPSSKEEILIHYFKSQNPKNRLHIYEIEATEREFHSYLDFLQYLFLREEETDPSFSALDGGKIDKNVICKQLKKLKKGESLIVSMTNGEEFIVMNLDDMGDFQKVEISTFSDFF